MKLFEYRKFSKGVADFYLRKINDFSRHSVADFIPQNGLRPFEENSCFKGFSIKPCAKKQLFVLLSYLRKINDFLQQDLGALPQPHKDQDLGALPQPPQAFEKAWPKL